MLMLLLLFVVIGLVAGITLLVIGIIKLCRKNGNSGEQRNNTAGVLFTVFGSLLTFIFLFITIIIISIGMVGI